MKDCGAFKKCDEICHLCAASAIYLPSGGKVRQCVGSLETNRMSLVAEGAP